METLCENLKFFSEDVREFQTQLEDELSDLADERSRQRNRILDATKVLKELIQKHEDDLLDKNEKAFSNLKETLERQTETCEQISKEVGSLKSNADDINDSGVTYEANDANRLQLKYDSLQDRFVRISKKTITPSFHPSEEDVTLVSSLSVGMFDYRYVEAPPTEFPSRGRNDQSDCFLTGIIWENKIIVVTDKANHNIKFFTEAGSLVSELRFVGASPYSVCSLSNTKFVATLPKIRQIHFITFKENVAKEESFVHTQSSYAGICRGVRPDSLIVTVASNTPAESHVDIIGYRGEVYLSFKNNHSLPPVFSFPRYVVANQGVIIVSDWKLDCVLFVHEATGNVLKQYRGTEREPLMNPYDITLDAAGNVYVLNGKDGSIHVLNTQCQLIDVIEDTKELLNPRLLSYNKRAGWLAVTHGAGSIKIIYHKVSEEPPSINVQQGVQHDGNSLLPPEVTQDVRCPSPGF